MQLIKKQERLGECAFYIGIAIHLLLMTVGYGDYTIPFHGRFMQIAFGFFCIKILTTYYSKKEWIGLVVLGVLGILSYMGTKDEYVVSVIVMIFAAKSTDMRRVCRWILGTAIVFAVGIAILSCIGIGGELYEMRDFGRGGVETRWCLGFGHANNLHGTIWYIVALAIYLCFEKWNWKHYLLLTIGNLVLFYYTASRGGMLATQIVIFAAVIVKCYPKIEKNVAIYVVCGIEIFAIVCLTIISAIVSPENIPVISKMDSMLTGRLHLIQWYADITQWKWISTGVVTTLVDDGWAVIFYSYGYVVGIVFVMFHLYLLWQVWKKKDGVLLVLLATSVFYIFMEASYTMSSSYLLCNVSYIIAMLLMTESTFITEKATINNKM